MKNPVNYGNWVSEGGTSPRSQRFWVFGLDPNQSLRSFWWHHVHWKGPKLCHLELTQAYTSVCKRTTVCQSLHTAVLCEQQKESLYHNLVCYPTTNSVTSAGSADPDLTPVCHVCFNAAHLWRPHDGLSLLLLWLPAQSCHYSAVILAFHPMPGWHQM